MPPNPPQIDFRLPMSPKTAARMAWGAWIMILIGIVAGVINTLSLVPPGWREACGGVSLIMFLVATEIRRRLPDSLTMKRISNASISETESSRDNKETPVESGPS